MRKAFFKNSKDVISIDGAELEKNTKNWRFLANKSLYPRNGAKQGQVYY